MTSYRRINETGRVTLVCMAAALIAAIAMSAAFGQTFDICLEDAHTATLRAAPVPDTTVAHEKRERFYIALICAVAQAHSDCARRACRRDVRECVKVAEFEQSERRLCGLVPPK